MSESSGQLAKRSFVLTIALSAMMSAVVAVATYIIQIPVPQTGGYINVGDAMIFTTAFLLGPLVGGFAGGVGSAIADLAAQYAIFAPVTLIIKCMEGMLVGYISRRGGLRREILAVGVGGAVMVLGYFLAEAFLLGYEVSAALVEVPGNMFQIAFGGLVGIPLSKAVRRYVPTLRY